MWLSSCDPFTPYLKPYIWIVILPKLSDATGVIHPARLVRPVRPQVYNDLHDGNILRRLDMVTWPSEKAPRSCGERVAA
jgi:hypothetical protein